ncbi:hypothetical protein BYT27DRAFT_7228995 [Phlegmacium glaucopus]|nr:hypothetical protein BYT27DRAFT_7228995 [Phlegmacium glaucopus]
MDEETAAFLFMQETKECEADAADQEFNVHLAAAVLLTGADIGRLLRNERQNPTQNYLCHTAWQVLFNSQNDRAYITTMGFNVETFELIIQSGFRERWYTQPIPCTDSSSHGEPRPGARSLDESGALGLILHYLNSTMLEITLQQIFALIPATTSCYITFGLQILLETLREMPDAAIRWPYEDQEFQDDSKLIVACHPQLEGAFASIDGLNLPTQTSDDPDIKNATYNGWLSEHYISSVIVFSPRGVIIAANFNAPGSWHDSHVAQPIYEKLHNETPDGFYLVADSAFPCGTVDIEGRIMAPIKTGQHLQGTIAEIEERFAYDRELLSYRQIAEWGMRSIQGSFGRLRLPLQINDKEGRADLLEICFRLHNLHTRRVGYNEIQKVYMSEWRKTLDDEELWMSFESMVFGDQQRKDRVSRFHIHPEYRN